MVAAVIFFVIIVVITISGAIWLILHTSRLTPSEMLERPSFRWGYIILPVVILFLSIVLVGYFYNRLPVEVVYRFNADGSPDRWLNRGMIILWMLLPQFFLTLLAGTITWGVTKLGALFRQLESTRLKTGEILLLMGNMMALPQVILGFAMLDIFSYNSYQVDLLPLWAFALIIMGLGGIVLNIFFIRAIRQVWRTVR